MDDQSPSITQNGTSVPGSWDRSFERSVLDQGVPYPEDMAGLPTSTPNPSTLKRRSRRSWFENTPAGLKLEIAIEKPEKKKSPLKSMNTEVLTLTHFTAAPRIDFGTMKPGHERMCTLVLRNPHECEQSVRVEKVPEKKHFTVQSRDFVVGPGETASLEITWRPVEAGNFREMLLMHVDKSYRLQAYVFGSVVAPPPKKKNVRRKGIMASKIISKMTKATAPLSVIQTNSLASINQHYSPEKKTSKPTVTSKPKNQTEHKKVEVQGKNGRTSGSKIRRSPRLSSGMSKKNSYDNQVQDYSEKNDENVAPVVDIVKETIEIKENFIVPDRKQSLPKPNIEEKVPRKKMRRSNTYSNVSGGLGLTVPIIHGEQIKGHKDTSLLHLDHCNISGIKPLEDSIEKEDSKCKHGEMPSFLSSDSQVQTVAHDGTTEPSFLEAKEHHVTYHSEPTREKQVRCAEGPSFLVDKNVSSHAPEEPSFLNSTTDSQIPKTNKENLRVTALKNQEPFQDSLDGPSETSNTEPSELPSFLVQHGSDENTKPRRSLRRSGKFTTDHEVPAEKRLLRSMKRRSNRQVVSPNSFLREMQNVSKQNDSTTSSHKPLNDSLGQSLILEQLKSIKSFIHEKSFEIEHQGHGSMIVETSKSEKEFEKEHGSSPKPVQTDDKVHRTFSSVTTDFGEDTQDQLLSSTKPSSTDDIVLRRGTFVTAPENLKLLETQKPSEASPRRTTFTVLRQTDKINVMKRSKSEGCQVQSQGGGKVTKYHNRIGLDTLQEVNSMEVSHKEIKQDNENVFESEASQPEKLQRLFSADSLENESNEEQFDSPSKIPVEQSELQGRRATLTVTKPRPSDALLGHLQKNGGRSLFSVSEPDSNTRPEKNVVASLKEHVEKTGDTSVKSVQNSTFEVSRDSANSSFPSTPNILPTSPNPDHSRRSTHVVHKPKVLDLSRADRKQLFVPETSNYTEAEPEMFVEPDKHTLELVENDLVKACEKSVERKEIVEEEIIKDTVKGNESVKIEKDPVEIDEKNSPFMNTRRRVSARRSLSGSPKTTKQSEVCNESPEQGNLFFIPLNDKSEEKEVPVKKTQRKDPQQFLRKRSNPVQQTEDTKNKRQKAEVPSVRERLDVAKTRVRPGTRAVQSETISVPKLRTQSLSAYGGNKPRVPVAPKERREVLKPKAKVMKGIAQSKLILVKKSKTAMAKHPLPFAAKNMYYDERWMEKQERGFVNWLNFILTPAEDQGNNVKVKVDAGKLVVDVAKGKIKLAPTNEVLSFRAYSAHRKLNRLRKSACRLFQSDSVIKVIQKIEAEVEGERLLVRKDKMLHADLGAKQKILDMLLSYNPLWLRIGLETIYGEVVPLQSNTDVYGLSRFILTRMVYNPDIAAEYAHPTVPHLYRDGYAEATSKHTLKKFLMLVYFLEMAKLGRLIEHNPCLFCKDSDVKTSKDLLLQFSRDFLSGEGDITRHLGYLGYKATFTQTALDEFDFAVSNLATDLRDGLRLSRVLELLCKQPDLSRSLRVPAISRLQKIHNVEAAFKVLTAQHIDTGIVTTRDIVDGHREKTLQLLWTIILQYQVQVLIDEAQLKEEVEVLQRSLKLRNQMHCLQNYKLNMKLRRESKEPVLHTQNEKLDLLLKWCRCVCAFYNIKIENFTVSFSDGRALCHILHYYHPGLLPLDSIHMDTVITHMESMEKNTRHNLSTSFNDSFNSSAAFGDLDDPELIEQLQNNERENFKVLFEKVKELGGVPLMLKWSDMSGTIPDEKVVVTYLLYLCARLLDIRHESRAARVIQLAWRKHRLAKMKEELKVKEKAACVIQKIVKRFLHKRREQRHSQAALCIQKVWRGQLGRRAAKHRRLELDLQKQQQLLPLLQAKIRGFLQRKAFLRTVTSVVLLQRRVRAMLAARQQREDYLAIRHATCVLQASWRGRIQRQSYMKDRQSVILVQSGVKRFLASRRYTKLKQSVLAMQRLYRSKCKAMVCRRQFLKTKSYINKLQAVVRGHLCRQRLRHQHMAATQLQSVIRAYLDRKRFRQLKNVTITCQRIYRAKLEGSHCRREFVNMKQAAVTIQSAYRCYCVLKQLRKQHKAATAIQAHIRGHQHKKQYQKLQDSVKVCQRRYRSNKTGQECRQQFLIKKGAAITIQATYRAYHQQKVYRQTRAAVIKTQACIRSYLQRNRYIRLMQSVVFCQRMYRQKVLAVQCRQQFLVTKRAVVNIQAAFRGFKVRKEMRKQTTAATMIQATIRAHQQRSRFIMYRAAVVSVQRLYRRKVEATQVRKEYLNLRSSAIVIQAAIRGYLARRDLAKRNKAAVVIQARIKGHLHRKHFLQLKSAALLCQKLYRNAKLGRECREKYLISKGAAITLQAAFRGYLTRKDIAKKNKAAIKIQALVKSFIQRKQYLKLKSAALICQKMYRSVKLGKECREKYLISKGAAITLQAAFRGYLTRKDIAKKNKAAIKIQAMVKSFIQRKQYLKLKSAALICQKMYRSVKLGKECREKYLISKGAAITLQAAYRGFLVRKDIANKNNAAIVIQSLVKGYLQRKHFHQLKSAVIVCQKRFRSRQLGRECRDKYMISKGAAITLQAAIRGYLVRKQFLHTVKQATLLQAHIRGFLDRKAYKSKQKAAVCLQTYFRAKLEGVKQRQVFLVKKGAAITVQAAYRGYKDRKILQHQHKSAMLIQSHVRGHLEKSKYLKLRNAAIICQRAFRLKQEVERCKMNYKSARSAVVMIQSAVRGYLVRRIVKTQTRAAVVLQSAVRAYLAKTQYQNLRQNVICCQRLYKRKVEARNCRQQFLIAKGAAITIQVLWRGYQVRQNLKLQHKTATCIQAHVRCYLQRKRYLKLRQTVILCQRLYRAHMEGRSCRQEFIKAHSALVTLQSAVRGYLVRKTFKLQNKAAVKIQSGVRGYLTRKAYNRCRQVIFVCQRLYRAKLEMKRCRQEFLMTKGAAISIQAAFRGHIVRKEIYRQQEAATKIQAVYRGYSAKMRYNTLQKAVVCSQRLYRAKLFGVECRLHYIQVRSFAVKLQAVYRGYKARQKLTQQHRAATQIQAVFRGHRQRSQYLTLKQAALICQKFYRNKCVGRNCRRQFLIFKGAAITAQACVRGFLERRRLCHKIRAARTIQAYIRCFIAKRKYTLLKSAAILCQRRYRAKMYQRSARQQYENTRRAIVILQTAIRGCLLRRKFKRQYRAAVRVQAWVRSYIERKKYDKLKSVVTCCQRQFRAKLEGERCRQEFCAKRNAALKLQAVFRGNMARRELAFKNKSATVIQTVIRRYLARQNYLRLRHAAMICQHRLRQKQRQRHLVKFASVARQCLAAMVIQRSFRNYRAIQLGKTKLHSITVIQCWFRSKLQRLAYLRDRQCVVLVQRQVRAWLCRRNKAACVIQRAVRRWQGSYEERKTPRAATKIQAWWRGHRVRANIKSKKLTAARHRVQKATASATEEQKLGNRTTSALDFLLRYKQLSFILDALIDLEVSTRLSWECCKSLVAANAVPILYKLCKGCNRSMPHMEIIKVNLSIMLNVAKYEQTRPSLYEEEENVRLLVELMMMFREKAPLFTKICNLLGIMSLDQQCKAKIMGDVRLKEKLQSIHNLTLRKHKMEETQRVTRAKMNATMNSTMNSTFLVRSPVKRHSIKPDWSLQKKDRMTEIENPLKGIKFVLLVLGIQSKRS